MDVLSPQFFGEGDFHVVPSLTNNTAKTPFGEYWVKIRPVVAEQSRQKKKKTTTNTELVVKQKTSQRKVPSN